MPNFQVNLAKCLTSLLVSAILLLVTRKLVINKYPPDTARRNTMNKNEILEKSKNENKIADPYEMEVARRGNEYGMLAAYITATALLILRYCQGQGLDYGLYGIILAMNAVSSVYNAVKLKDKKHINMAALNVTVLIILIILILL